MAPQPSSSDSPSAGQLYRRCARRLRATYGDRPGILIRSLRQMSQAYDRAGAQQPAGHPRQPAAPEVISIPGHGVRSFAERVADQIARDSSTLRYSTRLALLAEARRQGIRRFDANLIIAAVQERAGGRPTLPKAPAARRGGAFVATAATFLLVQAAIVLGAGMLLLS